MVFKEEHSIIGYLNNLKSDIKTMSNIFYHHDPDGTIINSDKHKELKYLIRLILSKYPTTNNIEYYSKQFSKSFYSSREAISKHFKLSEILLKLTTHKIIIFPSELVGINNKGNNAIITIPLKDILVIALFNNEFLTGFIYIQGSNWLTYTYSKSFGYQEFKSIILLVFQLIFFKEYIPIESKTIKPKQKYKTVKCKYLNSSKYPIEIIDSRWFTNIIVSGEFNVRGHFRLQPYGKGLNKKKIIWINEYSKSGYKLKNRKENLL